MNTDQVQIIAESIASQERTFSSSGFDVFLNRPLNQNDFSQNGFFSEDVINSIIENISGSKLLSGVIKSANGVMEMDLDEGVIKINFPGNKGFMKIGNAVKDNLGNVLQGILQNDGSNNNSFWGRQPRAF